MAEGWARQLKNDEFEAYSAGIETHGLNPNAVAVMQEVGIDITCQKSQNISEFKETELDHVITVCGHADDNCPILSGNTTVTHRGFDDPPKLALEAKTEEEKLSHYRRVRDEIKIYIESLPNSLNQS